MYFILLSLFAPVVMPFYLLTTAMDIDSGIARKLPPMENQQTLLQKFHKRNIYEVLVNANNQLLVENEYMDISKLKEGAKAFINNNGKNPNLSDNPQKAIVSLRSHKETSYSIYIQVQNELTKAYNELRNEKSNLDYGKDFNKLDAEEKKKIKKMYPQKISEAEPKAN